MVKKNPDYYVLGRKKTSSYVYWFVFVIIAFVAIYFPFFGNNLRYQAGATFSQTFKILGTICNTIGGLFMVWGLASLFLSKNLGAVKIMIIGALILFLGSWLIDPRSMGFVEVGQGYH